MSELIEFYHGWMIELLAADQQYRFICRSPMGERFSDEGLYPNESLAFQKALKLVDHFLACALLRSALRESYEAGRLPMEDWLPLAQSLESASRGQYSYS